jgi:hypothetical protein
MKHTIILPLIALLFIITGCSNTPKTTPKPMPEPLRQSVVQQMALISSCESAKHFSKPELEALMKGVFILNNIPSYQVDTKELFSQITAAQSKHKNITKQRCMTLTKNLLAQAKRRKNLQDLASIIASQPSTFSSNRRSYSYKPLTSLVPSPSLPNSTGLNSWATKSANLPTTMFNASDCIGTVVSGRCVGSIKPSAQYNPTPTRCYGTVVNGRCIGSKL